MFSEKEGKNGTIRVLSVFPDAVIENCSISGSVSNFGRGSVGGIINCGTNNRCIAADDNGIEYYFETGITIESCSSHVTILAAKDAVVSPIIASMDSGMIRNCYSAEKYSSDLKYWGGIVGYAGGEYKGSIKLYNCCADKFVGSASDNCEIYSCYYYDEVGNVESLFKPSYISKANRANKELYVGWDFENIWAVNPGIEKGDLRLRRELKDVKVEAPYANMNSGAYTDVFSVELFSNVEGGEIYYTLDGSKPTIDSKLYTGSIIINKNTILKTIAVFEGEFVSEVNTYEYSFKSVMPKANYESGKSFSEPVQIQLTTTEKKGKIYYTIDGEIPTTKSKVYNKPIVIKKDTEIKAIVVVEGKDNSDILTVKYHVSAKKPYANKKGGTYSSAFKVTLKTETKGASIYYTTDGKTPTKKSKVYKGKLTLKKSTTLKYIAVKEGWSSSAVATEKYVIK